MGYGMWCPTSMQSPLCVAGYGGMMTHNSVLENLPWKHYAWTHLTIWQWSLFASPHSIVTNQVPPGDQGWGVAVSPRKAGIGWRDCLKGIDIFPCHSSKRTITPGFGVHITLFSDTPFGEVLHSGCGFCFRYRLLVGQEKAACSFVTLGWGTWFALVSHLWI